MKLLRTILLAGFLGLMSVASQQVSQASAMQPPKFTLTDLGSVDGQANPYTPPTGYSIRDVYDPNKQGHRIGWTFTKDGSNTNLLPSDMANQNWYQINGYSTSGVIFGDDLSTGSSFYYNTNTNEYGNFKGSGLYQLAISSVNSTGQALGSAFVDNSNGTASKVATYYDSLLSDPVMLKDLVNKTFGDWVLHSGAGINDSGHIYGTMFNLNTYESRYYRLDPISVPEPSSFIVIAAGAVLLIFRERFHEKG